MTIYSLDILLSLFWTSSMSNSNCCFLMCIQISQEAEYSPLFKNFPVCSLTDLRENKQSDHIQPWCTPFQNWKQSNVPCPFLIVVCWPACRFLRRLVRWSHIPKFWRLFQFVVIQHTTIGFNSFALFYVSTSLGFQRSNNPERVILKNAKLPPSLSIYIWDQLRVVTFA